ncbi:hypothetical protein F4680DRAFT_309123 [Xylaria scruposa]|nr:hypothetical protein F4680DRAFT_309123 [Xylaria scruposa]
MSSRSEQIASLEVPSIHVQPPDPASSLPPPSQEESTEDHHISRTMRFIKTLRRGFEPKKLWKQDLTQEDLKRLKVDCRALDLEGDGKSEGLQFLEPIPVQVMRRQMAEKTPKDTWTWAPHTLTLDRWREAYFLSGYLRAAFVDEDDLDAAKVGETGIMECYTKWAACWDEIPSYCKLKGHSKRTHFTVDWILHQPDTAFPHVVGHLCDTNPFDQDCLSSPELACLVFMGIFRWSDPEYRQHKIVPVTLVSGSGYNVRLVHGYVDASAGRVMVYKSPILNFREKKRDHWVNMLRWILAKPVGDTERKTSG